jgi:phosphatidylserine/phosphatidylglycerophosphate/cardiolipin synthase-like enzyme
LHHKYAIVDPGTDSGWVITGSQNWSTNGEARNNENMILIRDRSLTEAYFQEWLARYHEAGGAQQIAIPLKNVVLPSYAHATFSSRFAVEWEQTSAGPVSIEVFDLVGNTVKRVTEHRDQGIAQLTLQSLTPGVYMVVLQHDRKRETRKILLY